MKQDQKQLVPRKSMKVLNDRNTRIIVTLCSIIAINTINSTSNRLVADAAPKSDFIENFYPKQIRVKVTKFSTQ
jgi:hypothetical protein